MRDRIQLALSETETSSRARILFACESGSRAWGFASTDSDYDVRFLYVRPLEEYLRVQDQRDVIEAMLPGDIDLSGWDLRKALALLTKSNPSLYEWLQSPLVYASNETFLSEFNALAAQWFSYQRLFLHYLHMAEGNWRGYLQGEEVSRKKYLYVLRPTLACRWIEQGQGSVPMEFRRLLRVVEEEADLNDSIERLLREKMSGVELAVGPPDPVLHKFIGSELKRLSQIQLKETDRPPIEELDSFFKRWVLLTS